MKRTHSARFPRKKGKAMESQFNSQAQQVTQFWQKAVAEQLSLVESFYEQLGKVQGNGIAQINSNIDDATRLAKQAFTQGEQLVGQWRKLLLETAKRATEAITPSKA